MAVFSSPVSLPELKLYDVYHGKMVKEISENRAADGTNPDTFIACETLYRQQFRCYPGRDHPKKPEAN